MWQSRFSIEEILDGYVRLLPCERERLFFWRHPILDGEPLDSAELFGVMRD